MDVTLIYWFGLGFGLSALVTVGTIAQERKVFTPGSAAIALAIILLMAWGVYLVR